MARGAGTWDAAKISTIEESAKGMTKQRNSMYLTNTIRRKAANRLSIAHGMRLTDLTATNKGVCKGHDKTKKKYVFN
jgi:hypothetical protein